MMGSGAGAISPDIVPLWAGLCATYQGGQLPQIFGDSGYRFGDRDPALEPKTLHPRAGFMARRPF
jgi:hypothetical protein